MGSAGSRITGLESRVQTEVVRGWGPAGESGAGWDSGRSRAVLSEDMVGRRGESRAGTSRWPDFRDSVVGCLYLLLNPQELMLLKLFWLMAAVLPSFS